MKNLAYKIIEKHLYEPVEMKAGNIIKLIIDNTLTQDATGTMAYLQLEAMGIDKVKTKALSYVDHNTIQDGFLNADDHAYLQSVANRYGVLFSKAGNGICHQVQLERFDKPGETLLGSDSHTPTAGGMAMIAIGAGGLDVACAMAGIPYTTKLPEVINVKLNGKLKQGVSAKDIILQVLKIKTVKGGVGKIFEYSGEGVKYLSVPERSTITNMGAELGATTSLFPSDENTKEFLEKQGRGNDYIPLSADENAHYDEVIEIDLDKLEPLVAAPHSPDNVKSVKEVEGIKVNQVCIGSCTNSSFTDLCNVASILEGKKVHPDVSLTVSFGSKQVLNMLALNGALATLISSGARLLESTCGPCIGMGQSPKSDAVSLRTFNRNFYGRSGTLSAGIYLVSPEVAAASAITGVITDPTTLEYADEFEKEQSYIDDSLIYAPSKDPENVEIVRGPNIKPLPVNTPMDSTIDKKVVIKLPDNITTDHIAPAGAKVLPYRSNIEKLSTFVFENNKPHFDEVCKENNGGIIVAGENYGQGSSREHAALAPMYLGIKAVLTKSFARIHLANLVNFGLLPLIFIDKSDYDKIDEMDELKIENVNSLYDSLDLIVENVTKNETYKVHAPISQEDIDILMAGGALNYIRNQQ